MVSRGKSAPKHSSQFQIFLE